MQRAFNTLIFHLVPRCKAVITQIESATNPELTEFLWRKENRQKIAETDRVS